MKNIHEVIQAVEKLQVETRDHHRMEKQIERMQARLQRLELRDVAGYKWTGSSRLRIPKRPEILDQY